MRPSWFVVPALVFLIEVPTRAEPLTPSIEALRTMPVQHNGRIKPLDSFASEMIWWMTDEERFEARDPLVTVLLMAAHPDEWQEKPCLAIPFRPLREYLGLFPNQSHISMEQLFSTRAFMSLLPPIVAKQQQGEDLTIFEHETWDLYSRMISLQTILDGEAFRLIPSQQEELRQPVGAFDAPEAPKAAWTLVLEAVRRSDPAALSEGSRALRKGLKAIHPKLQPPEWRLRLEVVLNRLQPFHWAWIGYLLATGLFLLALRIARFATPALVLCSISFLLHAAGIIVRVILAKRPPVSNIYESMLWLACMLVVFAFVFEAIYRARPSTSSGQSRASVEGRYFGLAASALSAITLLLAEHLPIDKSLSPIVAVLRSNLWLSIHVPTIVSSYAALTLATGIAHIYAWLYLTSRGRSQRLAQLGALLYRSIQLGVVLLAAGTILGALWANSAWGRYWGWDPKETWALITLLWFVAILHGRFAGWIRGVGIAAATIIGFQLLLMTYYGVNYFLVGLHSYAGGHAKPIPPLLIGFLVAEAACVGAVGLASFQKHHLKSAS